MAGDHDACHGHAPHDHDPRRASRGALRAALVVLFVLMVVEAVAGFLTNSLALISDAGHLLTDVAAVALALLAQRVAARPTSARRSFGFRRMEILAALINGLTLLGVAVYIVVEAYGRILAPEPVRGLPMLIVASVGLVGQTVTALILARARHESLNVRGAYLHAMTDAVQSVGVVAAGVVIVLTGYTLVDPVVSLVIALFIAVSGGRIVLEAGHVLLEGAPRDVDLEVLAGALRSQPGVAAVTDLHVWTVTTGYNAMTAHVVSSEGSSAEDREALCRGLTELVKGSFAVHHVTLQVESSCSESGPEGCGGWIDGTGDGRKEPP